MFLCVHVTPVRNTATVHRVAAVSSTPPHSLRRWRWISLRTTSLLQPSDMPLSANPEPAPPHTRTKVDVSVLRSLGGVRVRAEDLPLLLLVASLMTEELQEARVEADGAAAIVALLRWWRVAVPLHSGGGAEVTC